LHVALQCTQPHTRTHAAPQKHVRAYQQIRFVSAGYVSGSQPQALSWLRPRSVATWLQLVKIYCMLRAARCAKYVHLQLTDLSAKSTAF
jgi:hypothetical protein